MENNQPLLSICIPTYNRAEYLKGALENITTDPAFSLAVEIVISDNSSTDNTQEIGEEYNIKYSNVHYYRNEVNIYDKNFIAVQQKATGKYVRLFNDTLRFKEGALSKMIGIIRCAKPIDNLFFFHNISFLHNNENCRFTNEETLIQTISFYSTWIANWGCWRKDFDKLSNLSKYSELQLQQVDWFFQLMKLHSNGIVFFDDYFESIIPPQKGGYNFFKVFVDNYLYIIREHITDLSVIRIEKKRLFKYHLCYRFLHLLIFKSNIYGFETSNAMSYIWKEYKTYGCFYKFLLKIPLSYLHYTYLKLKNKYAG